jgi:hypothetical protein
VPAMDSGRRAFLGLMGGVASLAATPGMALARPQEQARSQPEFPPDIGRKFHPDGRVQRFDGNTIICHLDQQGPNSTLFDSLLDIYRDAPAHRFMDKVTLLPPSSYHMTVFGGANDPDRRPGVWPADLPLDLPMAECDRILGERLRAFRLECDLPFRMKVDLSEPGPQERPLTLRLLPYDDAENAKLRRLRDRLAQTLAIRSPTHDAYRFHVTLAYLIRWLTPDEQAAFRDTLMAWQQVVAAACPVIELGAPEYCTLKDMFAFSRQFYLR